MRVISRKILRDYCQSHGSVCNALYDWYRVASKAKWKNLNDRAIELAQELEHKANRSLEEDAILELLVTLIEKFEDENYPIPEGTPHSMLLHLMDSNEIKQENLVGVIGSRGVVSEVVNGKRSISKAQAKALAEFFSVDVGLFI